MRYDYIYCLRDCNNYDIFYVGLTKDITARFNNHKINFEKENINPILQIIEKIPINNTWDDRLYALFRETIWIKYYSSIGWNLKNVNDKNINNNYKYLSMLNYNIKNHSDESIIKGIKELNFKLKKIETDLNMPLNSLSGMINKKRNIPLKWKLLLIEYIEKNKSDDRDNPLINQERGRDKSGVNEDEVKRKISVSAKENDNPLGLSPYMLSRQKSKGGIK